MPRSRFRSVVEESLLIRLAIACLLLLSGLACTCSAPPPVEDHLNEVPDPTTGPLPSPEPMPPPTPAPPPPRPTVPTQQAQQVDPTQETQPQPAQPSGPPQPVTIESTPLGAKVIVDSSDTGKTTPATVPMLAGQHQVRLELVQHVAWQGSVFVTEFSANKGVTARLVPLLTIATEPSGAEITLNNAAIYHSPCQLPLEKEGPQVAEVRLAGWATERHVIQIPRLEPTQVVIKLVPGAELLVASNPPGAEVELDGQRLEDRTPVTLSLTTGKPLTIKVSKPGFSSETRKLPALKAGENRSVEVTLSNKKLAALAAKVKDGERKVEALEAKLAALKEKETDQENSGSGQTRANRAAQQKVELELKRAIDALTVLQEEYARAEAAE